MHLSFPSLYQWWGFFSHLSHQVSGDSELLLSLLLGLMEEELALQLAYLGLQLAYLGLELTYLGLELAYLELELAYLGLELALESRVS